MRRPILSSPSLSLLLGERLAFTIVLLVFALVLLVYLLLRRDNTFAHGENTPAPWIGPGYLADLMDECGKNEGVEGLPYKSIFRAKIALLRRIRRMARADGFYELRERNLSYNYNLAGENNGLRTDNSYFWQISISISTTLLGPTPKNRHLRF